LSDTAINQAKRYASEAGQNNIEFRVADAGPYIKSLDKNSMDGIFVLEMLFFHPEFMEILKQCVRVLKPGAILVASLRPQYYLALDLVKEGTLEGIPILLEKRSGQLFAGDVWFNWNTSKEIESLFTRDLGLKVIDLFGIGCCSGISGDSHASVALPSHLSQPDRDMLMQLETAVGHSLPDSGRYILVVSRKTPAC
jgi:SAM-dependent methyltransferase